MTDIAAAPSGVILPDDYHIDEAVDARYERTAERGDEKFSVKFSEIVF